MAQSGFTPIQLYFTTTVAATPSAGNLANGELAINITDGKLFYKDNGGVVRVLATAAGAAGDVVGPGSSTDNALVRFDGTTGKLVQNSAGVLDDSGNLTGIAALTTSGALTLNGGTANGVAYLNGSKVLTTGSALTFDGTNFVLGAGGTSGGFPFTQRVAASASPVNAYRITNGSDATFDFLLQTSLATFGAGLGSLAFTQNGTEGMRLTSTGLGIGTSSPTSKLVVQQAQNTGDGIRLLASGSDTALLTRYLSSIDAWQVTASYGSTGAYKPITWFTSDTERMRLDSSGNLGIGTSSPGVKLDVTGAGRFNSSGEALTVGASALAANTAQYFRNTSGYGVLALTSAADQYLTGVVAGDLIIASNGKSLRFGNAGTGALQATLDSSGNLGLGVTPSASWGSAWKAFEGPLGSFCSTGTGDGKTLLSSNAIENTTNGSSGAVYRYSGTHATQYEQGLGRHIWKTAGTGTAGNAISFTQAMTLDASGNLGVGTTSPGYKLDVRGSTGDIARISDGTNPEFLLGTNSSGPYIFVPGSAALRFGTSNTERARIDSSGNLLVGKTSPGANILGAEMRNNGQVYSTVAQSTNSFSTYEAYSTGAGNFRFYVGMGGTVFATSTTISAISDQRLKENVQDLDVGLDKIMALKPRKFDWKEGKGKNVKGDRGWIAQEFEQVFPDMIDTWKDPAPEGEEPYKSVRADLIPMLVKAIQEQQALITALTARISALESN